MQRKNKVFDIPDASKAPLITYKRFKKTHSITTIRKSTATTNDVFVFPGDDNTDFQMKFRKATSFPRNAKNNSSSSSIIKDRKTPAINTTTTSIYSQPSNIKKRKRNLVSQLRSANVVPIRNNDEHTTPTDLHDYHEQMEKVISELMVSEFGQDQLEEQVSSSSPLTLHPPYVPKNDIKASITYSRRNYNNLPAATFDGVDMEQLIKYILYGDL
ncbi:unnamed protein product [Absidia cylindrospora]